MRFLVYTCVFGGYDRVYPPVECESGLDYIIITDDPAMQVEGWHSHYVESSGFPTYKSANLHYRALIHRYFPQYLASVYVDGNIRVKGGIMLLLERFLSSKAALGAYHHPLRRTIDLEANACIAEGKVRDAQAVRAELAAYIGDGFPDDQGLVETTVLLKNHAASDLDLGMSLWNDLYLFHLTRDQLSLPYVLWKTGMSWNCLPGTFRDVNHHFALYPHLKAVGVNPLYVHFSARSHDSFFYRVLLTLWHLQWRLRRKLRKDIR